MNTFRRIACLTIETLIVRSDVAAVVPSAVRLGALGSFLGSRVLGTLVFYLGLACTLAVFGVSPLLFQPVRFCLYS
jgi:hypothetical protein